MGIIAGIGDKESGINLIKPEMDSAIYNYIIGKNTIIDGLTITNNILSKGSCLLCGYRGYSDVNITLTPASDIYIYGKFTIGFSSTTDSFEIETRATPKQFEIPTEYVNPTTINSAGTYYLLLYSYNNGKYNNSFDITHNYPQNAYYSDETTKLVSGGSIASDVTAVTQPVNDDSAKVATTEYVHNQIVEEIDYESQVITVNKTSSGYIYENKLTGTITLKRKAKYVIGSCNLTGSMTSSGSISGELGSVNQGFLPATAKTGVLMLLGTTFTEGSLTPNNIKDYLRVSVNPAGNISLVDKISAKTQQYSSGMLFLGYEI